MEDIKNWLIANNLNFKKLLAPNLWKIGDKSFLFINSENKIIFDENLDIRLTLEEKTIWLNKKPDYFFFNFGKEFYYTPAGAKDKLKLKPLKYIGQSIREETPSKIGFAHLGIHSCFEIGLGTRRYEDWIEKAKFLGYKAIGICEKNTLAGAFTFYSRCKSNDLIPILGETISLELNGSNPYDCKIYSNSLKGWKNLLRINAKIQGSLGTEGKVKKINLSNLKKYGKENTIILSPTFPLNKDLIRELKESFEDVFYQIDTVRLASEYRDTEFLNTISSYLQNYYEELDPILINDSYYLDAEDCEFQRKIQDIFKGPKLAESNDRYFKSLDTIIKIWVDLFKDKDIAFDILSLAIDNTSKIVNKSTFEIKTNHFHLPKFNFAKFNYNSSEEMLVSLVQKGKLDKNLEITEEVEDRINLELNLLKEGKVEDYFLILWDIIQWCDKNKILVGVGRGSAAGSIIAYLLGIVKINPLDYGLLFERFLNKSRIKVGLPDIDLDVETDRRKELIQYVKDTYGDKNFILIGTFKTYKIKEGIQDLGRLKGISSKDRNSMTSLLKFRENTEGNFEKIFSTAQDTPKFKDFVQNNVGLIHDLYQILNTPKSLSVHPCATVILPQYEGEDIYDYIPVRFEEDKGKDTKEKVVISEWDGPNLEEAGFLKEDLLSLSQLDKFSIILKLIKENKGIEEDIYHLNLNDRGVYQLFHKGYTGDVFQFHSRGLTYLSEKVKPDNIEELGAMVALYRPGPISSNAHKDYIAYKFGKKKPIYDFGLKEVTENTFGLYIYQEQVMKACVVLGGFTLEESEGVRKAMGKKIISKMESYQKQFVKYAVEVKKCPKDKAIEIWDKLNAFSGYGFNKSHAIAYAITGYISQYLKYYYPLEFFTAAFQKNPSDEKARLNLFISEIRGTVNHIKVIPPDINKSKDIFTSDKELNEIYWSLAKIKQIGDIYLTTLLKLQKDKFYSFSEFLDKVEILAKLKEPSLNKRVIINLILSGAFDRIEDVKKPTDRLKIIEQYFDHLGIYDSNKSYLEYKEWWCLLTQKKLTGLGYIDYQKLINVHLPELKKKTTTGKLRKYISADQLQKISVSKNNKLIISFGGIITEIEIRTTKTKENYAILELESNDEIIYVNICSEEWLELEEEILKQKGNIMLFGASVANFSGKNILNFFHRGKNNYKDPYKFLSADNLKIPTSTSISVEKGDKVQTFKKEIGIVIKYPNMKEISLKLEDNSIIILHKDEIEKVIERVKKDKK